MKIQICQINSIIGDIEINKNKIVKLYSQAVNNNVDLVIFPELTLCGYPPLDLVEKKEFIFALEKATSEIASITNQQTALIFGTIFTNNDDIGAIAYNSAVLCFDGKVQFVQQKSLIPYYDVFDEIRYFEPSRTNKVFEFKGKKLGITICEDIWNDPQYWSKRRYHVEPVESLVKQGVDILLNLSASPYSYGKRQLRYDMLKAISKRFNLPLIYCCYVGAQTELIFDGASMCFDSEGNLAKLGKAYQEDVFIFDTEDKYENINNIENSFEDEIISALKLGISDYANKLGFQKALIGLSGGIDSALVTYLAVEVFGNDNVTVVMMPSMYSSEGSLKDSLKLIENLGIKHYYKIPITDVFKTALNSLAEVFNDTQPNIAEENLQSRIRGLFLMAISNKFGHLLLTTGNKSEIATGYATLYGDMCGALAVIGDLYKTDVYKISNYINKDKEIIPIEIITKAPSAELRENQKDQDTLPPYDLLDNILKLYLEENKEINEISDIIGDREVVKYVLSLVDKNEFKRKQAAPILRVTSKAFGIGRRYPIIQNWRKFINNTRL
jgi:NAD+ synthetase